MLRITTQQSLLFALLGGCSALVGIGVGYIETSPARLVACSLALSVLLAFLGALLARRITVPIEALTHVTRRLASDELYVEVPSQDLDNEVGDLARAVHVLRQSAIDKRKAQRALLERTRMVELFERCTSVANEISDGAEATVLFLREIADFAGWQVGHCYLVDPDHTHRLISGPWHITGDDDHHALRAVTARFPARRGVGLPGRILVHREPAWVKDLSQDRSCPRARLAAAHGLRSSYAFPVLAGKTTVAILEFFSSTPSPPPPVFTEAAASLATELGRVFERERATREIERAANHDALTGLASRRLATDRLEVALAHARRAQSLTALMYIDLDGFKSVNDTMGHLAGDEVLCAVAKRLKHAVREVDTVARLGGDEFLVIVGDVRDESILGPLAQRVIDTISSPVAVGDRLACVGASVGVAVTSGHGVGLDELVQRADAAMYEVKHAGKNGYAISPEPQMNNAAMSAA